MSVDHRPDEERREEMLRLVARAEEAEGERDSMKARYEEARREAREARKRLEVVSRASRDFTKSARAAAAGQHGLENELRARIERAREERNEVEDSLRRMEILVDRLGGVVWEAEASAEGGVGRFTFVGRHCEEVLGYPRSLWFRSADFWMEAIHPDDRERVRATYAEAAREGVESRVEFRAFTAEGAMVWLQNFTRHIEGENGTRLRGIMVEITERKQTEETLRKSEEKYRSLFEQATEAVFVHDIEGNISQVNEQACESLGYSREELLSMTVADVEMNLTPGGFESIWEKVSTNGDAVLVEGVHRRRDGSEFPVEVSVGRFEGDGERSMLALARDATVRKRAEEEREAALESERRAREHLAFLAEASRELASFLELDETLSRTARLAVPRMAEWCVVSVLGEDGHSHRLAISFQNADSEVEVRHDGRLGDEAPEPVREVIRTGEPLLVEAVDEAHIEEISMHEEHLERLRGFGLDSYALVPLRARGRTFGTITFARNDPEKRYDRESLSLLENFAGRASLALDNARLYRRQRHTAEVLQRSLLPHDLPEIPGLDLAARLRPLGEGVEMGGDFYDLFEAAEGRWSVVIGDVLGKGPEAAAATSLARHTLRSVARSEKTPSRALEALNAEMLDQQSEDDRFCTVLFGNILPNSDGGGFEIEFASGGHPLPVVLRSDGSAEEIGLHGTLLGVYEDPELFDSKTRLAPGDAVIFYTDGVTEARREGELFGEERVMEAVSSCAGLGAAGISDRLEERLEEFSGGELGDDAAILVVKADGEAVAG